MAYCVVRAEDIEVTNKCIPDLLDKADSAAKVSKQIASFVNDSPKKLVGDIYDAFRTNLEVYSQAYDKLSQLCIYLADHIDAANTGFLEYISACIDDDPVNARDHIPKYEEEIKQKENLIKQKEARISTLERVQPTLVLQNDGQYGWDNSEYEAAQAEIASLRAEIEKLQKEILELKKKIEYLKKLSSEDDKACQKVEDVKIEIDKFVGDIESLKVSNVS